MLKKGTSQNQVWTFAWRYSFSEKNYPCISMGEATVEDCLNDFKGSHVDLVRELRHQAGKKGKFIFQLECTEVKELDEKDNEVGTHANWHYQGYLKTDTKRRPRTIGAALGQFFPGIQVDACSTAGQEALREYCMKKDESYRAGPWADKPIEAVYTGEDLKVELWSWQKDLLEEFKQNPDSRKVVWIYDDEGGIGKSWFAKYVEFHNIGETLSFDTAANLQYQVVKAGARRVYVFDLPRTKSKAFKIEEVYSALESIKNGLVKSNKYDGGKLIMTRPHVVIFSNYLPGDGYLSKGRIDLRTVNKPTMAFVPHPAGFASSLAGGRGAQPPAAQSTPKSPDLQAEVDQLMRDLDECDDLEDW